MRVYTLLCSLLASLLSADLGAQMVWPQGFAGTNGGASSATPFSISSSLAPGRTRAVVAIAAASLPFSAGQAIQGIAFRRDAVHGVPYAGYSANVRVRIRVVPDALMLTASAHKVFLAMHEVFNGTVAIPGAGTPPGATTAPFALSIPFATSWSYPGGDLAIELTVTGPPGAKWRCDTVELPWSDGGQVDVLGAGCATSAGDLAPLYVQDPRTLVPGGDVELVVDRLVPPPTGALVVFAFGARLPGMSLAPLGLASSCQAFVQPIDLPMGLHGNRMVHHSRGGITVAMPNAPGLVGARLAVQAVFLDFALSSALPLCLSQAIEFELGAAPPMASAFVGRVQWIHGAGAAGSVQGLRLGRPNRVPVIEFL